MTAEITHFPKRCHLHDLPMTWEDTGELSSGWKCPKCTLTCPAHGDPMRSGIGALYPVGVLYCRRCRIIKIRRAARSARRPSHELPPLSKEGVVHLWRNPT